MDGHDEAMREQWQKFGQFLSDKLHEYNVSATSAAEAAGMTLTQWSRIVNGKSGTRRTTIPRIAGVFGIAPEDPRIDEFYIHAGFPPPKRSESFSIRNAPGFIQQFYELPQVTQEFIVSIIETQWSRLHGRPRVIDDPHSLGSRA